MDFILICIFHIVLTSIDLALSALGLSIAIATFSGDLDEPRAPGAPGRHDREGSRVPGLRRQVHPLPLPALPHPEDEEAGMVKPLSKQHNDPLLYFLTSEPTSVKCDCQLNDNVYFSWRTPF